MSTYGGRPWRSSSSRDLARRAQVEQVLDREVDGDVQVEPVGAPLRRAATARSPARAASAAASAPCARRAGGTRPGRAGRGRGAASAPSASQAAEASGHGGRSGAGSAARARRAGCPLRSSPSRTRRSRLLSSRSGADRRGNAGPPSRLAWYIATSACLSRGGKSMAVPASTGIAGDADAGVDLDVGISSSTNGSWRARLQPLGRRTVAAPESAVSAMTTANSSPPRRASRSVGAQAGVREASPELRQQEVAGVVAERVVELLEAVEVDHRDRQRGRAVRRRRAPALQALVEQPAVREPGQLVGQRELARGVQRGVLVEGQRHPAEHGDERRAPTARRRRRWSGGSGRATSRPPATSASSVGVTSIRQPSSATWRGVRRRDSRRRAAISTGEASPSSGTHSARRSSSSPAAT